MAITNSKSIIETPRSLLTMSQFSDSALMTACIEETKDTLLHHPPIVIYGKPARQRRDVGFYSDESEGYRYSGQMAKSQPVTASLEILLAIVNQHFKAAFNGILINRYSDGADYISAHSDDERFLDKVAGVVAISSGATRTFVIRGKIDLTFAASIPLTDLSVVHMSGDFQKEFTHAIPTTSAAGVRYSFTFRRHEK